MIPISSLADTTGTFSDRAPCRRKQRRPPSPAALAEAAHLRGGPPEAGAHVVVDFTDYVNAAARRARVASTDQEAGR